MDYVTIFEAVGSSGVSVLIWNVWNSHRVEKASKKAELRNEKREPLVADSIALSNEFKTTQIMRQGIEELVASKRRLEEEMNDRQGRLEDKIEDLTNENQRLRKEFLEQEKEDQDKIKELMMNICNLQIELNKKRDIDSG